MTSTKYDPKWFNSKNREYWLFALFHLWNRCRKESEPREFYKDWWFSA